MKGKRDAKIEHDEVVMHMIGNEAVPLNYDWTMEEVCDRLPDIPIKGRLTTCVIYCHHEKKNRTTAEKHSCVQKCQPFVNEIEEQEREDLKEKSLQRAKELGPMLPGSPTRLKPRSCRPSRPNSTLPAKK